MTIQVSCTGFTALHAHINGAKTIECSYLKILLAAITCGYDGFFKQFPYNWHRRLLQITGSVIPYVRRDRTCGFKLDPYYFEVDNSENKQGSYYIGQALTKVFSEQVLDAPLVLHASACTWTRGSTRAILKAPLRHNGRKEADLFAFGRESNTHVLEAKGRTVRAGGGQLSTSTFNSARAEALGQVSSVATINGRPPATRSACIWTLCTSGIKGNVEDPDGQGSNVLIKDADVIRNVYSALFESRDANYSTRVLKGYSTIQLTDKLYFGVKTQIRRAALLGESDLDLVLDLGKLTPYEFADDPRVAGLADGTILYDRRKSRGDS